jgi:hypothetical protein
MDQFYKNRLENILNQVTKNEQPSNNDIAFVKNFGINIK